MRCLLLLTLLSSSVLARTGFDISQVVKDLGPPAPVCTDCEPKEEVDLSFYSDEPVGKPDNSYPVGYDARYIPFHLDQKPVGFELRMRGPNPMAGAPIDPSEKVERQWRFVSKNGSRRETYLSITDDAGSGYLSQLMESVLVFVPRKGRPHAEVKGNEIHVTLTTGEKVIYDKATNTIKSGVLSEGPVDLNPNRFERKFAPLRYTGSGLVIRVDKRGEEPRLSTGKATITQGQRTCQVPAKDLWMQPAVDFKFKDDEKLLQFINSKCGGQFSL